MNITAGNIIHGFKVTAVRAVDEINSVCYEMRHIKTGAELVWMDSGAENKLFSIAFKTIPEDSTGVFHILEHSVLCGSENYPVKEPFVELLKSSLNTFLNAMTFPDKTMYPVSSRNKTDFINLSRVYLDAVFKPAILNNPNIFYQEGWHYELESADAQPVYNGVVFNEMKGAYSSVDRVAQQALCEQLFPDSCYGLSSGGDPEVIPDLTYEQFISAYRRHYHPSNSRIYLDGNVPLDEILAIIDIEYLSGFEASGDIVTLEVQQPISAVETTREYEAASEDTENKTIMITGKVICDWSDRLTQLAAYVLGQYLTGSNDAPLKKAILDAGLAQDVTMSIEDGIAQPFMYLLARNCTDGKHQELRDIIKSTASAVLENGIEREDLIAVINNLEFNLREGQEPIGLERAINALSSWLYGGDPLLYLTQDDVFRRLREQLDGDFYPELLRKLLIDQSSTAVVWCVPSTTLGDERKENERRRIAERKAGWSKDDTDSILALNTALNEWQQTPDSEDSLARLPVLSLDEVNPEPTERVTSVSTSGGVTVLRHPSTARGIAYISLYFDIADIAANDIPSASLLTCLLGRLPTAKHTVAQLDREIKTHIGSLSFGIDEYGTAENTAECRLFITVRCSVLESEYDSAVEIIREILTETRFDRADEILTIIRQQYDRQKRAIVGSGHRFGLYRTLSCFSAESAARELADGYSFCEHLRNLCGENADIHAISAFCSELSGKAFCRSRVTVSITADGNAVDPAKIIAVLPSGSPAALARFAPSLPDRRTECIEIPAGVSYAAMGLNISALGSEYSAAISLLGHIMSYHYLWNAIRVQGGAYGAGLSSGDTGNICYYTYRDPNSSRSLDIFRSASEFLRKFCADDESLDKPIIGCISHLDTLVSAKESGIIADADHFRGITHRRRCQLWRELLTTDKAKLLELSDILDGIAEMGSICVIGGAELVSACENGQLTRLPF